MDVRCVYFDENQDNSCSLLRGYINCDKCSFKKYKRDILPQNRKYVHIGVGRCCYQNPNNSNECDLLKKKICKKTYCSFKNEEMTLEERQELFEKYSTKE